MKVPTFLEQIDRLFEEMVRDRWTQRRSEPARVRQADKTHLEVQIPLLGGEASNVAFAVEGQSLVVTLQSRQSKRAAGTEAEITSDRSERAQHTFTLPEDADLGSLEARFEGNMLRLRVELRTRRG